MAEAEYVDRAEPRSWTVTAGIVVRSVLLAALFAGAKGWLAFGGTTSLNYFAVQAPSR